MSEARTRWVALLKAEMRRREAEALGAGKGNAREQFIKTLREIAERLRAAPDWRAPTPAQKRSMGRRLDRWFRVNGYGTGRGG